MYSSLPILSVTRQKVVVVGRQQQADSFSFTLLLNDHHRRRRRQPTQTSSQEKLASLIEICARTLLGPTLYDWMTHFSYSLSWEKMYTPLIITKQKYHCLVFAQDRRRRQKQHNDLSFLLNLTIRVSNHGEAMHNYNHICFFCRKQPNEAFQENDSFR